jgi:ribonuclease HII
VPIQIGTDEAGYGPNLGPLVVSGTAWSVPNLELSLYELISEVVAADPSEDRIAIADSKLMFRAGNGIAALETSVLALVCAISDFLPRDWMELIEFLCGDHFAQRLPAEIWLSEQKLPLPLAADRDRVFHLAERFSRACEKCGTKLNRIHCVPIFPREFNDQVALLGNKAHLLSKVTLNLVQELLPPGETTKVVCDKHGGRSKYAAMLQQFVTDQYVRVHRESLEQSCYSWCDNGSTITFDFAARGEYFLPTALASMVSKYTREIFMRLWNDFWCTKVPKLRPTQGYPGDARRFKAHIAAAQRELNISDHTIWRER